MGPAIKKENIDELYKKLDQLQDGDILVLAGSIPSVMPETMYSNIMEYLRTRMLRLLLMQLRIYYLTFLNINHSLLSQTIMN